MADSFKWLIASKHDLLLAHADTLDNANGQETRDE